jgi:hypothetical protein
MPKLRIKPNMDKATKKPHKIRLPGKPHEFLPAGGADVEKNKFWIRRLRDKSVVETKTIVAAKKAAAAETKKKVAPAKE